MLNENVMNTVFSALEIFVAGEYRFMPASNALYSVRLVLTADGRRRGSHFNTCTILTFK